MSEYQYYEFRAIDRPLTDREMAKLRALSTRADITPVSFTNEYHWGNFKGDPLKLMHEFFDAFVYTANWGTHRLMFRLPRGLVDLPAMQAYATEETLSFDAKGDHVVVEFHSSTEDGDWYDEGGEGHMASLLPVREALLSGDDRALYIAWLAGVPFYEGGEDWDGEGNEAGGGDENDDTPEPPVPPGLRQLTAPLKALADFLRVDADLLDAAAGASTGAAPAGPTRDDLSAWVRGLPVRDKDDLLVRVAEGDAAGARRELLVRFRKDQAARRPPGQAAGDERRTIGQLVAAARVIGEKRRRAEAERRAAEKARRDRKAAAEQEKHLDDLAKREPQTWAQVEALITSKPAKYEDVVSLLKDLRDLAARSDRTAAFAAKVANIRERFAKRPSLMERMDKAGFASRRDSA